MLDIPHLFCYSTQARLRDEPVMTSSGGNFISGEINRNERSPRWGVATIEVAENRVESAANLENDTEERNAQKGKISEDSKEFSIERC